MSERGFEIREITDPATLHRSEVDQLTALRTAMMRELDADEVPASTGWALGTLYLGNAVARRRPFLAYDESRRLVGQARLVLDQVGNPHVAQLADVEVHPDHRRQGVGRVLVAHAVDVAQEEGRTSLVPWGTRSAASLAFWASLGAPEVGIGRMSRLRLADVDRDLVERWRTGGPARAQGYQIHRWKGRCPDELLALVVAAQQGMHDAPTDDLDLEPETLDEAWVRAREQGWHERGGEIWGMVAVSAEGEAAGLTELVVMHHRPSFVQQQGTTTLRAHRKRGVGRWLKAEMLEQLLAQRPEVAVIETGNAASNTAMLSINGELGFRPFVDLTTRQVDVSDIAAVVRAAT